MKCVTNTLLLCLCVVVLSRAQPGIHITSLGDVGIGDETPYSRLTMSGTIGFHNGTFPLLYMYESEVNQAVRPLFTESPTSASDGLFYDPELKSLQFGQGLGSVWLRSVNGTVGLRALVFDDAINTPNSLGQLCGFAINHNKNSGQLEFIGACSQDVDPEMSTQILSMSREGNVGIGAPADSMYQFQVNGPMRAQEIVVETGWADYVFAPDYELKSLDEVERYIADNQHLPGIPSAADVESQGLSVGDMSRRFMEKIEELTLYTISQEKQIELQQQQIERLMALTSQLESEVKVLKNRDDSK